MPRDREQASDARRGSASALGRRRPRRLRATAAPARRSASARRGRSALVSVTRLLLSVPRRAGADAGPPVGVDHVVDAGRALLHRAAPAPLHTSAISVHGIARRGTPATATSLAPFSQAGAVPPARPGLVGEAEAAETRRGRGARSRAGRAPPSRCAPNGRGDPVGVGRGRSRSAGACRACESWAMVAPSVNSTIEWTIDCGCTTTSIAVVRRRRTARGPRSPRGPCSSACDESTVIFGPIGHVGWARASSTVTSASSAARAAAERARRWR